MKKIEVGVYHWSNWHPTEENDKYRGKGWTEWEYVKSAIPRFKGHNQPKFPIWGYLDDSKEETVLKQINTASAYGIDAFIFDWVYKGNQTVIERFIRTPGNEKMKFALMNCGAGLCEEKLLESLDYVIDNYFSKENYWRVDGGCYYSVYEIGKIIKTLGGIDNTARVYNEFRKRAADKGHKIHFVAVEWGLQDFWCKGLDRNEIIEKLGIDAITSYTWYHNTAPAWPCGDYAAWAEDAYDIMLEIEKKYPVPYYTHVSAGWDQTPRCPADMEYTEGGPLMYHNIVTGKYDIFHTPYFSSVVTNDTPEEFRRALLAAKRHIIDTNPKNPIVTLYAWNEWTEGGYLEPDSIYGYGKLEAIKDIFGNK